MKITQISDIYVRNFKLQGNTYYSVKDLSMAFNMTQNQFKKLVEKEHIKGYKKKMEDHNGRFREESVISHKDFFRFAIEGKNRMCTEFTNWLTKSLGRGFAEGSVSDCLDEDKLNPILDFYIITHLKT